MFMLVFFMLLWVPATFQKHPSVWNVYVKLPLDVNECVCECDCALFPAQAPVLSSTYIYTPLLFLC